MASTIEATRLDGGRPEFVAEPVDVRFAEHVFSAFFAVQWIFDPLQETFRWRNLGARSRGAVGFVTEPVTATLARYRPASQRRLLEMIQMVLATGEPRHHRLVMIGADGDRDVECFALRERNADGHLVVMGIIRSIADLVGSERRQALLDHLLTGALNAAFGGMLVTRGQHIMAASARFRQLLGMPDDINLTMKPIGILKTVCSLDTYKRLESILAASGERSGVIDAQFIVGPPRRLRYMAASWSSPVDGAGGRFLSLESETRAAGDSAV